MTTYPLRADDGTLIAFEISNAFVWTFGPMRKILESVPGVTDFKHHWFKEIHFSFKLSGRDCIVWEPWGDNSRYWIGPKEMSPPMDMTAIHKAFMSKRFAWTVDREFRA